ncbi:MAG: NAD(P)-binding domain-containing protein, partial [Lachnospiraceae bacterium]|nr:NAD(P)-binding domain-containing protein [Lachnospiraceae bacterium]
MKIGFIGLGNMALAMIVGMLEKGIVQSKEIVGSAKHEATAQRARERFGI